VVEGLLMRLPGVQGYMSSVFAMNYAMFGLMMIFFLLVEPGGLVGAWRRISASRLFRQLWPRHTSERAND
jgi:branched-chain amino acid transport system permease protein